ncbi:SpoIIE family protein phosphatase [Kitasatospora cineracea]|uniref:PAS domain-containing protein n=1 Tax=Kitasatospora cineracea TaxID=88074 RepID=A0A8G1XEQ1_9ACTN|nr:SpoIIE family protein phosphatase [Kitasatospora cineracea]ROR46413.1 PAS domain-containing protein [Kitasatospora cineracea]
MPRSLAARVFLLQLVVIAVLVAAALAALVVQARQRTTQEAYDRSMSVAESFAHAPGTLAAMESADPSAVLQPAAEQTRTRADVAYIVAFAPDGTRWSHPDPTLIGGHVSGNFAPALAGEPFQETFDSTLFGRAVDTTVPVFDPGGKVAGLVSVGIQVRSVQEHLQAQLPVLFAAAGTALALAAAGSALVSRRLRRQTHGLGPAEMTRMYEHHDAVLHAVREGVVITGDGRLQLANDEARRLLALPADPGTALPLDALALPPALADLLATGRPATDEVHPVGERLLAVNQRPVGRSGRPQGAVATLRDTTELRALAGRAETAHRRLDLLYAAGLRIGTTLDVTRTAEELARAAVPGLADYATVELLEPVLAGAEPEPGSTAVRRTARTGVRTDFPLYPLGHPVGTAPASTIPADLAAGRALRIDLAGSDDWCANPDHARDLLDFGLHSVVSVPLQARDLVLGVVNFWRADQPPFTDDDLAFAEELALRAAVSLDNARRYTREHATATALQRSLLPGELPAHRAVDTAWRYRAAEAGVGGDWFDVIPLSGARVALVVGDVVGHGVGAAAAMGRLRTAVHNFSALDLDPDELLARLDEFVTRLDPTADGGAVTGATCLYAVYDPATGHCAMASAGHPPPALLHPDGTVHVPDLPLSPPLGTGEALPAETIGLHLDEGTLLVLFTDGLLQPRRLDPDDAYTLLAGALAGSDRTPDGACTAVLDALPPDHPDDDVALLVARARRLDPDRIAEWRLERDPATVSRVRADITATLERWDLAHKTFTTELIISELVTNTIRYGTDPVRLRLLCDDRHLICEVADGSSTSPHLRRAADTDEGGRGLYLVARCCERWGTRYLDRGKIIWVEQDLAEEPPAAEPDADALLDQWDDL